VSALVYVDDRITCVIFPTYRMHERCQSLFWSYACP